MLLPEEIEVQYSIFYSKSSTESMIKNEMNMLTFDDKNKLNMCCVFSVYMKSFKIKTSLIQELIVLKGIKTETIPDQLQNN